MADRQPHQIILECLLQDHPANQLRWSKTSLITLHQAVFLSYGIEPPVGTGHFFPSYAERFLEIGDYHSIWPLLQNAIEARLIRLQDRIYIKAEDFVCWAKEHALSIREEFFYYSKPKSSETQEPSIEEKNDRRMRADRLRREAMLYGALLHWRKQERHQKEQPGATVAYTRPTDLSRLKTMKQLVQLLNTLGDMDKLPDGTYSDEVNLEWFSKEYPGEVKAGPKPKKKLL